MTHYTVVHFSQDFAAGKAQLGGFSRIFNLCGDANAHVVYTVDATITAVQEFAIGAVHVVSIPVRELPRRRLAQLRCLRSVSEQIVRHLRASGRKVDVFFGHSQLFNFFVLRRVRDTYPRRIPLVWEANAIWGTTESLSLRHLLANRANRFVQRYVFQGADMVVFQTEAARQLAIEQFGVARTKSAVVTNAVIVGDVTPLRRDTPPFRVLCVGLFDEMNGIPLLVRVLESRSVAGLQVTFIGDGKYRAAVERLRDAGRCNYLGSVPHAEMQIRYRDYDFVVIPRLPRVEAHVFIPTKLLEAMHHGVVPICSDVRAMRDVVRDGENGLLFRAADESSLLQVLQRAASMTDRGRLAEQARRTVCEQYDWRVNHARLARIYAMVTAATR